MKGDPFLKMIDQTPLSRWAEFNERKWKCTSHITKFQVPNQEAYGECLLFKNHHGNLILPHLNPYHPVLIHTTPTNKAYRTSKQWHDIANLIIDELLKYPGNATLCLPPGITDVRPFLWRGFKTDIKYTFMTNIPYSTEHASKAIRNKIRKAHAEGYRSEKSNNMEHVYQCLIQTEQRQGFDHQLNVQDLELARDIMGESNFRCYICYSKDNEPVSANISIILNHSTAIGWIAGTKKGHLSHGVVQQLQKVEFEDLETIGIQQFDFAGANIASVSESKSHWGGELVPYYVIRKPQPKDMIRAGRDWIKLKKVSN